MRHLLNRIFERSGCAVMEIRSRQCNVTQRRHFEEVLIGVFLRNVIATEVLRIRLRIQKSHFLIGITAKQRAVMA